MKFSVLLLSILLSASTLIAKDTLHIRELVLKDSKLKSRSTSTINVFGCVVSTDHYLVEGKSRVQMSCNYGDPSKNEYKTVHTPVTIDCVYDSSGVIRDSLLAEIERYCTKQEQWSASCPQPTTDFTFLSYHKSFYVKDSVISLYMSSEHENTGAYRYVYVNQCLYKFELQEAKGLGSLSSFMNQNIRFERNGQEFQLGTYVKNTARVREILAAEKKK